LCRVFPDQELTLQRKDGIKLAASLYLPIKNKKKQNPAIVLLHGNTVEGRKSSCILLLSKQLAEKGYLVIAPDFAGYGKSEDPFELNDITAINSSLDIAVILDWLEKRDDVDQQQINLLAHSGGSIFAMDVASKGGRVHSLALIGPPRQVEIFQSPENVNNACIRMHEQWQYIYHHNIPKWYTQKMWSDGALGAGATPMLMGNINHYLPYFTGPAHIPILLIDGSREFSAALTYLFDYTEKISQPKKYVTLKDSDHYMNTFNWCGLVLYDARIPPQLLTTIDNWFQFSR
jgi:pimeloyl-ACP methyl ester carboxylesterase